MVGGLLGAGVGAFGLGALILPPAEMLIEAVTFGVIGAVGGAAIFSLIAKALREDVWLALLLGAISGAGVIIPVMMITGVLKLSGLLAIVLFIIISPIIGMLGAFVFDVIVSQLFKHSRQNRMKRIFQPLHVVACLVQATAHGANDGQHAVGVITALLLSAGILSTFQVPAWVILTSAIAIGLGTCFGGWQVVDKMAKEITKIRPYQGFCAATASSGILVMVTSFGVPVSSTHAINGAIVGVGATRGKDAVHWQVVREMMLAWIITIPLAFVVAFGGYQIISRILPVFGLIP
jgi:PiT family inorganic phosphate transporter